MRHFTNFIGFTSLSKQNRIKNNRVSTVGNFTFPALYFGLSLISMFWFALSKLIFSLFQRNKPLPRLTFQTFIDYMILSKRLTFSLFSLKITPHKPLFHCLALYRELPSTQSSTSMFVESQNLKCFKAFYFTKLAGFSPTTDFCFW